MRRSWPAISLSRMLAPRSRRQGSPTIAIGLALLIVLSACTGENFDEGQPRLGRSRLPALPRGAVELEPLITFQRAPNSVSLVGDRVAINRRFHAAILPFKLPEVPVSCVRKVELWLYNEADPLAERGENRVGTIVVYPSTVVDPADIFETEAWQNVGVLDKRPRALAKIVVDERGWIRWDVSRIYRLWVGGRPFPTTGARVPADSPLTLLVRPPRYISEPDPVATPTTTWTFVARHNADESPRLRLLMAANCKEGR